MHIWHRISRMSRYYIKMKSFDHQMFVDAYGLYFLMCYENDTFKKYIYTKREQLTMEDLHVDFLRTAVFFHLIIRKGRRDHKKAYEFANALFLTLSGTPVSRVSST